MNLRVQALSGLRWTASVRLVSQVVTWAITLVVIRILSPADYGLLAMATVFIAFLGMFSELGLGAALVQGENVDEPLLKRTFGVVLAIHLTLAVVLFIAAPFIASFYREPQVTAVVQVLSLQFIIGGFAVVPGALLQRRMEFRVRALLDLSAAIVASGITLVMALSGAGVWSLVAGSLVGQLVKTVGTNWYSPFLHMPDFSLKGMRGLLRFGGHFTGIQVIWMFLSQVDSLICARLLGKDALGFYSVGMHLASLPSQKISGLVNQVAFPTFSRMQADIARVQTNVLFGIRILSFVAFPTLWGMSSMASDIVRLLLGEKWLAAVLPLQVLALIIPIRMIGNFVGTATQGIGRTDILLRSVVVSLVVLPLLLFVGAREWGMTGLLIGWLIASPLLFLQAMINTMPALNMKLRQVGAAMFPAALASSLMYGAVALTRQALTSVQGDVIHLVVMVLAGAATYVTASLLFNRKGAQEFIALMRNIVTKK